MLKEKFEFFKIFTVPSKKLLNEKNSPKILNIAKLAKNRDILMQRVYFSRSGAILLGLMGHIRF